MSRARVHNPGFALFEVIVGAVILAISLVGIIGLTSRALGAQARGEQLENAAMLIDEQLNLVLAVGPDLYPARFRTSGPCEPPYDGYEYEVNITSRPAGDPYLVRCEVRWTAGGKRQKASVETLIAPRLGDEPDPDRSPEQRTAREAAP